RGPGEVPAVPIPAPREACDGSGPNVDDPRSRPDPVQPVEAARPDAGAARVVVDPTGVERGVGVGGCDLSLRRARADEAVTAPHTCADVGCRGEDCEIASPT